MIKYLVVAFSFRAFVIFMAVIYESLEALTEKGRLIGAS